MPPTKEDLLRWEEKFGSLPVNTKGVTFKKHKDHYEALSKSQQLKFLSDNSSMIKRPILERQGKVLAFGFDEKNYKSIL